MSMRKDSQNRQNPQGSEAQPSRQGLRREGRPWGIVDGTVRYGDKLVLDRLTLELPPRGVVVLFGPSGCGKTTLLDALCGFVPLDEGRVIGGEGRLIARTYQENRLLPWCTVGANVAAILDEGTLARADRIWGCGRDPAGATAFFLSLVGLEAEIDQFPDELSGGMQKRLGLARAAAYGSDTMVLDEPTVGIDEPSAFAILDGLMERWVDDLLVLVTHDHELAVRYASVLQRVEGPPLRLAAGEAL